jgi:hypothetical protein
MGREAIYQALFDLAKTATGVQTNERAFQLIDNVMPANMPYLCQVEPKENYDVIKGVPFKNSADVTLYLYVYNGQGSSTVAMTQLNNMLDALDAVLAPNKATYMQTLGGLVSHAWIKGGIQKYSGIKGNEAKAMAIIPINLMFTDPAATQDFSFDAGYLYAVDMDPTADATPILFGSLQETRLQVLITNTDLRSGYQQTHGVIQNSMKIKGVAKNAQINGRLLSQLVFGQPITSGGLLMARDEAHVVPGSPYTVVPTMSTVMPGQGGGIENESDITENVITAIGDLGAVYASTGLPLTLVVDKAPGPGEYRVSVGNYIFNASDSGKTINITYLYNSQAAASVNLANAYQGRKTTFKIILNTVSQGKQVTWVLDNCSSNSLNMPTSLESFNIPEFAFEAYAGSGNSLGSLNFSQ